MTAQETDVLVVGGGLGGVAAAVAAARLGRRVVLTEESPWLGGQITAQGVPPDEHPWIEEQGATRSYRRLRENIRAFYRRNYDLAADARTAPLLNPGGGAVSAVCHEPRVGFAAIEELLAPYRADAQVTVLEQYEPVAAQTDGDRVSSVTLRSRATGAELTVSAPYILDATELGDLLELAGVEHVTGAESRNETGELHAPDGPARPLDQQSFTWCFAMDYHPDADYTIDRPADYAFWRDYQPNCWPGPLLSWQDVHPRTLAPRHQGLFAHPDSSRGRAAPDRWNYRRIFSVAHHVPGRYKSDITLVNWPQVDYMAGPLTGVDEETGQRHLEASRRHSLSFLYWMQTEAPRLDGGTGYRGLRPRGDVLGTTDGLALRPYIREARRIRAEFTVLEQHVGVEAREKAGLPAGSEIFPDSVGVGSYRIDLHPSTGGPDGPNSYIDIADYPFQVPLGALIPQRVENLLPANKNIGTTHITNGCYRLHPVEWNIGEAAGALAAHCLNIGTTPRAVRNDPARLAEFQQVLTRALGFQLGWPERIRTAEQ
ncbi:FAD-dependent oxidoreductase [Streptomyces rugosispiralis]|uniref:FAD-dependent oxidoreductase n=1 Tax=Streptomyces rugosispiralis TaxID=2967341 RepID=A0ABT1V5F8_9ACTN|nr:FAD-dependent oxidoreductase [Streptomyces rugosispiralis]MCQ8192626.1 FAD-dependent oxidoreductase [Streptomyces rugosispiralis]